MKHIFILNPKAGIKDNHLNHERLITDYFSKNSGEYEIHITEYAGHAKEIAKKACEENSFCRIYSFGGDGTFNEVISGAYEFDNYAIGIYPCGTGNDFVKTLSGSDKAPSIESLVNGSEVISDVINVNGKICVNLTSTGFDGEVAKNVAKFKKIFTGNFAYTLSTLYCFITKTKFCFKVDIDGKNYDGNYIFIVAANGRYYGGGYFPAPNADISDGLIDFVLIKTVSRLKILTLIGKYKKGTHLDLDITKVIRGKKISIQSEKPLQLNIDGEAETVSKIDMEIIPSKVRLINAGVKAFDFTQEKVPAIN